MEEKKGRGNRGLNKWVILVAAAAMVVVVILGHFYAKDEAQLKEYAPDDIYESKDVNVG